MQKTLKKFLKEHDACADGYEFAKDLTLEQFLTTCHRGDWILWLFTRMNQESIRELTLAAGHWANTVREHMRDERSKKAVDVAIAFGEGKATREELVRAARDAYAAWAAAADADAAARAAADAAWAAAATIEAARDAAWAATWAAYAARAAAAAADAAAAEKANQKLTADICRKYLPLEIWNQSKL